MKCNSLKIKELLFLKKIYQKDLAEESGLTEGTISRIILTQRGKAESLRRIAKALDVPIEEIALESEV